MQQRYHIEDLLANEEFIEWVVRPTKESDLYWSNLIENLPERREDFFEARRIIASLKFRESEPDQLLFNRTLQNILNDKLSPTHRRLHSNNTVARLSFYLINRAAAIILIVVSLGLAYWFAQRQFGQNKVVETGHWVIKENPKGQKSTFFLPDSSRVTLNSESQLRFKSDFLENRHLELDGEAYFEVTNRDNSNFIVTTGNINTVVIGTSFNVRAYDDEESASISLNSGRVAIKGLSGDLNMILSPGEKALYDKRTKATIKTAYDRTIDLSWKDGILVFQKTSLSGFIRTIERWYDVSVKVEGVANEEWMISGKFNNESLKNVLESLRFARKIDYTLNEDSVTLKF